MALTGSSSAVITRATGVPYFPPVTMSIWLKLTGTVTGTNYFFYMGGTTAGHGFNLHFTPGGPYDLGCNIFNPSNFSTYDLSGANFGTSGSWFNVVFTADNGGTAGHLGVATLYINGTQYAQATLNDTGFTNSASGQQIEVWAGTVSGQGVVEYPAIWNTVLSGAQITSLAAQANPTTIAPSNLQAFASFADAVGPFADLSTAGTGLNWTITGSGLTYAAPPFSLSPPGPTTWFSNGDQTGGSGPYVAGTQSVQYIHDNFVTDAIGDIIQIPAGTFNWNSTLTITKSCTIQGVNPGINGNVASPSDFTTQINNQNGLATMMTATAPTTGHITICYLYILQTVDGGSGAAGKYFSLVVDRSDVSGGALVQTAYTCLVHDCYFDGGTTYNNAVMMSIAANGIIVWECTFSSEFGANSIGGMEIKGSKYGAQLNWNTPDTLGAGATAYGVGDTASGYAQIAGLNNTYVETCTFLSCVDASINSDANARAVIRYCTFQDSSVMVHGSTSQYPVRHNEIYGNTFVNVSALTLNVIEWIRIRSGTHLIYNNVFPTIGGGKGAITLALEQVNRANYVTGSPQLSYPATRQIAIGWSQTAATAGIQYGNPALTAFGVGQQSDPIYIWGNSGALSPSAAQIGINQYSTDTYGSNNLTIQGQIFFNQTASNYINGSGTTIAATFPGTINANTVFGSFKNDLLLCMVSWLTSGTPTVSVSDGGINFYTQVGSTYNGANGISQAIFAAINTVTTCTGTVTATFSTSVTKRAINIADYAGNWRAVNIAGTIMTDGSQSASGTNGSINTGTITETSVAGGNDLIIVCARTGGTPTGVSSGWTQRAYDATNNFGFYDNVGTGSAGSLSTATAYTLTATTTAPWNTMMVAFASQPFLLSGRDYNVGTVPTWTPYTYPHPLTGVSSTLSQTITGPVSVNGAVVPIIGSAGSGLSAAVEYSLTRYIVGAAPGAYTPPSNNYLALYSTWFTSQAKAGATEWGGGSYSRTAMGAAGIGWSIAAYASGTGVVWSNLNLVTTPAVTGASQGLMSLGFCDSPGGGVVDFFVDLTAQVIVPVGIAVTIPIGGVVFTTY